MKKLLLALLSISSILLNSCNSEENKIYADDIIGKWDLTSTAAYKVNTTNELVSSIISERVTYTKFEDYSYIKQFQQNGTGITYESYEEASSEIDFTYNISKNNILTIKYDSHVEEYEIIKLRNNELKIVKDMTDFYQDLYRGIDPNIEIYEVKVLEILDKME